MPKPSDRASCRRDGISRACASKWVNRYRHYGELGPQDRSSTPQQSPNATPAWVLEKSEDRPTLARPHGAPGCEEGGRIPDACQDRRSSEGRRRSARLGLAPFHRRRVLPAGLLRASTRREGPHRSRVPGPGERLVRRPRHRPDPPCRDRQRRLLPLERLRPNRWETDPAPQDPTLHSAPQRQSRALPTDSRRGSPRRPPVR